MTATTFDLDWIHDLMTELKKNHEIFHNEKDFQESLGRQLHSQNSKVYLEHPWVSERFLLECPSLFKEKTIFTDIWIPEKGIAIELKYCTRELPINYPNHDVFQLSNQGAQNQKRYDFLRDIQRLERLCEEPGECKVGYAVFLTNDSSYWNPPWTSCPKHTSDKQFRLSKGRPINGILCWEEKTSRGTKTSKGTMKDREDCIHLNGCYTAVWKPYSTIVDAEKNCTFKYLAFRIPSPES